MSWVTVTDTPVHHCALPSKEEVKTRRAGKGSVWECDDCHVGWTIYGANGGEPCWRNEMTGESVYRITVS